MKVGPLELRDPRVWSEASGQATVEALLVVPDRLDMPRLRSLLRQLEGGTHPVVIDEVDLDGWWTIRQTTVVADEQTGAGLLRCGLVADRVGGQADVAHESLLVGADRPNEHSVTGERWHAPPVRATSTSLPDTVGSIVRVGAEGPLDVYRSIPDDTDPVWTVAPADALLGAARAELDGVWQPGAGRSTTHEAWRVDNTLVRVASADGALRLSGHDDGTAFGPLDLTVTIDGTAVTRWLPATVLHADPWRASVRTVADLRAPVTLDVTVLRGSRTVAWRLQTATAVDHRVETGEVGTDETGYLRASSGDKWLLGTDDTYTAVVGSGRLTVAGATASDWWAGWEPASPQAGDTADDLQAQHVGAPDETVRPVRR